MVNADDPAVVIPGNVTVPLYAPLVMTFELRVVGLVVQAAPETVIEVPAYDAAVTALVTV